MTRIVDSDQHLYENRWLWADHMDPAAREEALSLVDDDLGCTWLSWRGAPLALADVHLPGNTASCGEHRNRQRAGEPASYRYDEALPESDAARPGLAAGRAGCACRRRCPAGHDRRRARGRARAVAPRPRPDLVVVRRPSEYVLDHIRVSSLSYEDPEQLTDKTGDVFVFCSVYPHSEGTATPLDDYRRMGCDEAAMPGFFHDNIDALLSR